MESFDQAIATATDDSLAAFTWPTERSFGSILKSFFLTRDCYFFPRGRLPVVEVTFQIIALYDLLELAVHFTWAPPLLGFAQLSNVVTEGDMFTIKPKLDRGMRASRVRVHYSTDIPSIQWNDVTRQLEGIWPSHLAQRAGAQRFDGYTMHVQVLATTEKAFPGGMIVKRAMRVAVPVSVRRRPDRCLGFRYLAQSPPISRPSGSEMVNAGDHCVIPPSQDSFNGSAPAADSRPLFRLTPGAGRAVHGSVMANTRTRF